ILESGKQIFAHLVRTWRQSLTSSLRSCFRSVALRHWPRADVCTDDPSYPLNGFDNHLLEFRFVPVILNVSQGRVIHAPFPVHLGPRHCEVAIVSMHVLVA